MGNVLPTVIANNPRGLLTSVLLGVQAEVSDSTGLKIATDTKYRTFFSPFLKILQSVFSIPQDKLRVSPDKK